MKELVALPDRIRRHLDERILALAQDPKPHGSIALQGGLEGFRRIRSGDYRVIYSIEDVKLIVTVIKIGNRRDIYER